MRRRPPRGQLRTRVLAGVLSITLAAFAAFDIVAVTELRGYLLNQTDQSLQTVLNLSQARLDKLLPRIENGPPLQLEHSLDDYYLAFESDQGSNVILEADPDLAPRLPSDLSTIAETHRPQTVNGLDGQAQLRLRAMRVDGGTLVVTASLHTVDQTVGRLQTIVTIGSITAVLLIALGVVVVVRRGLRPLETMATQADRITAGDLTNRVGTPDTRSEVGRLGAALNGMLTRIESSVHERDASQELMRRFFADASHELRTPLASLRANAELYQQGALTRRPEVDEAMRRIGLEARRMSRLVDDMLRLARLDQHPEQQNAPVDLTAVLNSCVESARIADPDRTWQTHIASDLMVLGDEELLRRAVDNLVANVVTHTPGDTVATVRATAPGHGTIAIEVSDNGPGVPADRLPHIFDRFYRAGTQSPRSGSGLGLAIVTEIAAAHEGTTEAALNYPHGLRITLTLPAQPRTPPGEPPGTTFTSIPHTNDAPL